MKWLFVANLSLPFSAIQHCGELLKEKYFGGQIEKNLAYSKQKIIIRFY
jgi:hypothetical protein